MSRRKQSHPRHLENDGDAGLTADNGPQSRFEPVGVLETGLEDRGDDAGGYFGTSTCSKCHTDFLDANDLRAHEPTCRGRRLMPVFNELDSSASLGGDLGGLSKTGAQSDGEEEEEDEEEVEEEGMLQEELLGQMPNEIGQEEGEEGEEEEDMDSAVQSEDGFRQGALGRLPVATEEGFDGENEEDEFDYNHETGGKGEDNKENMSGISNANGGPDGLPGSADLAEFSSSLAASIVSGMFPTSNVTLEPMASTRAAVAQFPDLTHCQPENRAAIQKWMEGIQRQQMATWQVIHQLYSALVAKEAGSKGGDSTLPNLPGMPPSLVGLPPQLAHLAGIPPNMFHQLNMAPQLSFNQQSMSGYLSSQAEKIQKEQKSMEEREKQKEPEKSERRPSGEKEEESVKSSTRTDPVKPSITTSSETPLSSSSSTPITSSSLSALTAFSVGDIRGGGSGLLVSADPPRSSAPVKREGGSSSQYSSSSLTALQRETDALKASILPALHMPMTPEEYRGYCQRGTVLERSQYACDDPFFKHKCRFCHKVFGSDSALQIHVRSHTGERPFKCNICGNRFSTKGNLKVHFERHKAKYPHVKMNPNPVPEHFDRLPVPPVVPPPLPSPMGPSTPIPSSMPLPTGMMSGEHSAPPGIPRMMFPPVSSEAGFFSTSVAGMGPGFMSPPPHPRPPLPHLPLPSPRGAGSLMSPIPKMEPLPPTPSPKHSPRDTPSKPASEGRSPSRADSESAVRPSSQSSAEKACSNVGGSRASSPPPPSSESRPGISSSAPTPSCSMSPATPVPPLIPVHPPLPGHPPTSMSHLPPPIFSSHSLPSTPSSFPLPSPLSSGLPMMRSPAPFHPPPPMPSPGDGMFRNSILPSKTIDPTENLEQYMEIQKSETSKLEALVKNIDQKINDPNQCVICHRVLSCKSALQMHYRIHTGERPFKCKLCQRCFTTKGNLKTHMGVHRAKPPIRMMHQCPVCHKQFTNLLVLQQHIRMHTGSAMHALPPMGHFPQLDWPHRPPFPGPQRSLPAPPVPHSKPYEPFDLSRQKEPKELDLSNKPGGSSSSPFGNPRNYGYPFRPEPNDDSYDGEGERMDEDDNDDDMMNDESMDGMDERDAENYSMSREGARSSESALHGGHSAPSENGDSDRPDSNMSAPYSSYDANQPLPPTTEAMDGFMSYPHLKYNTSLAALEERVKAIDSQMSQSSFERFRNSMGLGSSPFFVDKTLSSGVVGNGGSDKSPISPRSQGPSETGSDGSREDSSKQGMPADMGMSPLGFSMLGGLDAGLKPNTTCNICLKTFACKSALDIHYRSHTKERPFKCDMCDRAFSTRGNLKQHQLTHKTRDMSGDGKSMENGENSLSNTGTGEDEDSKAPNSESSRPDSAQPASDMDEPKSQSESQVNGMSPAPESDSKHTASSAPSSSSSSSSPSSIPLVSKPPPSNAGVSSTSGHNNNSNSFPNNNAVKSEPRSNGTGSGSGESAPKRPKHQCNVCTKIFSSHSALQIHTRTHTGDKPFKCTVCQKAFTTRGNLKVHMGTHMWNNSPSRRGRRMSIDSPFLISHMRDNPYLAAAAGGFPAPPRPPHPEMYYPFPGFMNGMGPKMNEISVIQSLNGGMSHHLPPMYPFPHQYPGKEDSLRHPADLSLARSQSDSGASERDRERERERERERGRGRERERSRERDLPHGMLHREDRVRSPLSLPNGSSEHGGNMTTSGELDLSMKPGPQSSPAPHARPSPNSTYPTSPVALSSPPAGSSAPPPPNGNYDDMRATSPSHNKENTRDRRSASPQGPPPSSWLWNAASCHHCGQTFQSTGALEQHIQTQHLKADTHSAQKAITA